MDELDQVTDSAHHGEPDCDGAADLEVLCATRRRRRGSGVSPNDGVGFGARGGVLPFLSGFVHREMNCVRGGIKVRVSIRVFGHVPGRATGESGKRTAWPSLTKVLELSARSLTASIAAETGRKRSRRGELDRSLDRLQSRRRDRVDSPPHARQATGTAQERWQTYQTSS